MEYGLVGLIALEELTGESAKLVLSVLLVTIVLSVLAHGLSAGPIAATWPRSSSIRP